MNDPAVPNEQPSYWGRCERMGFRELREFIDDSLKGLFSTDPNADRPSSEEEFWTLLDMLREKADIPREGPYNAPPPRPAYVAYPGYIFEPSEQLASLQDRRERLLDNRDEALYNRPRTSQYIRQIDAELRALETEIELREAGEREEFRRRRNAYEEYERADSRYRRWQKEEGGKEAKRQGSVAFRKQIISRISKDIERAFKSGANPGTNRLHWRPLPQGKSDRDSVTRYYKDLQRRNPALRYDQDRIDKAYSLRRNDGDEIHEGADGFDGYLIFTFDYTPKVLMECAWVGNAIYIIGHDWETWAKKTKQELKADESGLVKFIPHQGDWFERVKKELGTPDDVTKDGAGGA